MAASFIASTEVGSCTKGSPRRYVAATYPARSPTTPPPSATTVVSEFLFRPETIADPSFAPQPVIEFWDLISRQDWGVCERAQTGVGSRAFTTGVYPRQDRLLFFFNQQYRRAMGQPEV